MSNQTPNRWSSIKTGGKKLWDKGWDVTGKYVGEPANTLVGKWGIESFWPSTTEKELDKAARILRVFTLDGGVAADETLRNTADPSANKKRQKILKKIPPAAIEGAKGIAIFTVFRTGLHWSAASGSGIVISRLPDGSWSAPSGILIHTLGIGFVIGVDIYDVVLVLNTDEAVQQFAHPRVKLGGEVTVAAGPVGDGRQLDVSRSASWSYVKSKGFYAGAQLDGTIIIERGDENERFYGQKASAADVLAGKVPAPAQAAGLYQVLAAAAGRPTSQDKIPQGLGPSEHHADFVEAQQGLKEAQASDEVPPELPPRPLSSTQAAGSPSPPPHQQDYSPAYSKQPSTTSSQTPHYPPANLNPGGVPDTFGGHYYR
ncbi:hypothetical protein BDV96DRAFT_571341 [Lophiotrema nucula]|uniref:Ysc84 actin-binding domain-containing protein n=1 Tax=Lophiotrema nucula TaxID=690887 RepID=A0A6A5ZEW7_9PLEO|nr:hypothetical protein BDV96DRAFT_571341 [Lophiotrema nucula]